METIRFANRNLEVAADLRFPADFDPAKKYPAIVCGHPISSCKEQTSGSIYGERLAEIGYVTLAFDASYQGASSGEPRFLEDPATRVEDFKCAVDHLVTLPYVDEERIGVLGICGGGGYAVNAAMTEHRFKAVGTVVAANYGRLMREGDFSPKAAIATLEAIGKQRTAEARGGEPAITTYIPMTVAEREQAGLTDVDIVNAVEYYRTDRGQSAGAPNQLRFSGLSAAVGFDAFHLTEHLLTQPLQIIVGDVPGAFGSYRDGFELYGRAASADKNLLVVPGASHYDLYDRKEYVDQALERLQAFYAEHL
ncbi:alpha/beta hydrolase [Nocardia sp. alder85J]|uniref:alpha/beta hydrolase n=1 Tax=Nocardia sp. alder85J TaxID=2862949 RepID=UPI001CD443C1|nr:alpha/beta hydrolase [Nocardia sp. alder85J]MCX4095572.1 alpha/beta hydrolase [Nocardia sp. alder85J]